MTSKRTAARAHSPKSKTKGFRNMASAMDMRKG